MIHYYTYYSVGGYKDMCLGNQSMNDCECTYYLPMLPIMEEEASKSKNETLNADIAALKKLPKIKIATSADHIGLSSVAFSITTKGCYKLIYTHLEDDKYAIILHDVNNGSLDNAGRQIPFLVMFMSDTTKDLSSMNKLALYLAANMKSASKSLGEFFNYDATVNGLRFELAKMNSWVESILRQEMLPLFRSNGNVIDIGGVYGRINLLVVRSGIDNRAALEILSLDKTVGVVLNETKLLPHDDEEMVNKRIEQWKEIRQKRMIKILAIGGSCLAAALLVYGIVKWVK